MINKEPSGPAFHAVHEIVSRMGYAVVDFSAERVKGRTHVHCVLHHPDGINLDRLGEVHAALQPRLEVLLEDDDLYIEFSSPGIERTLKSFHEFSVFLGKRVKVLPVDASEWTTGKIVSGTNDACVIEDTDGTRHTFHRDAVNKARLTE